MEITVERVFFFFRGAFRFWAFLAWEYLLLGVLFGQSLSSSSRLGCDKIFGDIEASYVGPSCFLRFLFSYCFGGISKGSSRES